MYDLIRELSLIITKDDDNISAFSNIIASDSTLKGTIISLPGEPDPIFNGSTYQQNLEIANIQANSGFYGINGKIEVVGKNLYPKYVYVLLMWSNTTPVFVGYLYTDAESEPQLIGTSLVSFPYKLRSISADIEILNDDTLAIFYRGATAGRVGSGIRIERDKIPFEVSNVELLSIKPLENPYYIVLDSEYKHVFVEYKMVFSKYVDPIIRNISGARVYGDAIESGALYVEAGLYIAASETVELGKYTLTLEVEGLTSELNIKVVQNESDIPIPGPYEPGGSSGTGGGEGSFGKDELSDIIFTDIPDGSSESDISSAGLFTRYVMSTATTRAFGDWLFSDNIIDTIVKEFMALIFASPMEAIISMISYPFSIGSLPGVSTSASNVFYGNKDSGIASLGRLTNGFATIDWGTVAIAEYWGNFLDYSPHTKIELYLPWSTGFVDLDPNDVMNSTISIVTNIELDKGTCIHNVYNGRGAVIGQYSGVCGKQLPITALDTSGKALSAVVAATAVAVSAGAAGITAAGAAATESAAVGALRGAKAAGLSIEGQLTAAESMRSIMSKFHKDYTPVAKSASKVAAVSAVAAARVPPHIQRSGSFTGNGSGMGVQYPYFILSRPDQSVPDQYGAYVGYPSNIYSSLGALSGYTEVGSIYLDGIACTENERAEIDALLKGGVIL